MRWLWDYLKALAKSVGKWLLRYPLAAAATVFIVAAGVALILMGKDVQLGGIIGRLFGREKGKNVRGVPPEGRRDEKGEPIPPGESDEKGYVQAPVSTEIKKPGLFDDPDTIVVVHPEKGEVVIDLPEGVKNKDVREVVEIRPDVYEVRNNDKGVNTDDLLKTLGEK